jgi:hypothetical protein
MAVIRNALCCLLPSIPDGRIGVVIILAVAMDRPQAERIGSNDFSR